MATARPTQSSRTNQPPRETVYEQIAGFVSFFIYLLVMKGFFLPLFVIPTGSMAATLNGAHADHTCPNCGFEFAVGVNDTGEPRVGAILCPNCRWFQLPNTPSARAGRKPDELFAAPLRRKSGDRIVVHGWPYEFGGRFDPQRWDVVVFKVPRDGQTNYIKRLLGKPGETVEIIDGDLFIDEKVARKSKAAQQSLWFPYYQQDYLPRGPANIPASLGGYQPRWITADGPTGRWMGLDTRTPRFDGLQSDPVACEFVTSTSKDPPSALITNLYGYNDPRPENMAAQSDTVTDLRVSCEVQFQEGAGALELCVSKLGVDYIARLYADGRIEVLRRPSGDRDDREVWGTERLPPPQGAVPVALGHADHQVTVEVGGRTVWQRETGITAEQARKQSSATRSTRPVRIAADHVRLTLAHLRLDRDVHYTSRHPEFEAVYHKQFNGVTGNPLKLGPNEFFVCGDNSPNSADGRWWQASDAGPHLQSALASGDYQPGTVPRDQLIGQAFLVYWPGFHPLLPMDIRLGQFSLLNLLPDTGRIRWIR